MLGSLILILIVNVFTAFSLKLYIFKDILLNQYFENGVQFVTFLASKYLHFGKRS